MRLLEQHRDGAVVPPEQLLHKTWPLLFDLVERMTEFNPDDRIDIESARLHPALWRNSFVVHFLREFGRAAFPTTASEFSQGLIRSVDLNSSPDGWIEELHAPWKRFIKVSSCQWLATIRSEAQLTALNIFSFQGDPDRKRDSGLLFVLCEIIQNFQSKSASLLGGSHSQREHFEDSIGSIIVQNNHRLLAKLFRIVEADKGSKMRLNWTADSPAAASATSPSTTPTTVIGHLHFQILSL